MFGLRRISVHAFNMVFSVLAISLQHIRMTNLCGFLFVNADATSSNLVPNRFTVSGQSVSSPLLRDPRNYILGHCDLTSPLAACFWGNLVGRV